MFTYDIVAEGKETLGFYELFGEKRGYKADFPPKVRKNKLILIEMINLIFVMNNKRQ